MTKIKKWKLEKRTCTTRWAYVADCSLLHSVEHRASYIENPALKVIACSSLCPEQLFRLVHWNDVGSKCTQGTRVFFPYFTHNSLPSVTILALQAFRAFFVPPCDAEASQDPDKARAGRALRQRVSALSCEQTALLCVQEKTLLGPCENSCSLSTALA